MKSILIFLKISILFYCSSTAQSISQNIFLVGNTAKKPTVNHLEVLRSAIMEREGRITLIYSGDILRNSNIEAKHTAEDSAFIKSLIEVVKGIKHAKVYFIPGDEDWNTSEEKGWKKVKKLEELINGIADKKIFLPEDGCPGPEIIDAGENLQIVFISTPWWIYPYKRRYAPDTKCDVLVKPQFIEQLKGAIEDAEEKNVLVVGHHPAISNGNYGGRIPFSQHLKPPVIGTFLAGYHQNVGSPRDIAYPAYGEFANNMKYLMQDYAPFIYASSHDFNLQALEFENSYQVVSGSMFKKVASGKSKNTVYKSDNFGFVELLYYDDGKVMMGAYELENGSLLRVESIELYQSSCNPDQSGAPVNTRFVPCREKIAPALNMDPRFADSIGTAVGASEYKAGFVKKVILGPLYRTSWTATIEAPYLNLDSMKGGLIATGKGGGKQTLSLSLEGGDGKTYVFRSIHKDPILALDPILRKTFVVGLSRQLTATQNPYGAMPVSFLLNSTNILHAQPQLFILPDDPKLGMFQEEYGGVLGILEEKAKKGKGDKPGSYGADDVVRSYDLFRQLYKDHDNRVDVRAFAEARLFDIWIGDWDRNEDNWKWAGYKKGNKTTYYPIPRDRDHVFSLWNGLVPYLADRKWGVQNFEHFDYDFGDLKTETWAARHLDRFLLSSLDKEQWMMLGNDLQKTMNDSLIDLAIQQFPDATIPLAGNTIGVKLKTRRDELPTGIEKYYKLLSKNVDVVGSNKAEYFKIKQLLNGNLEVSMYDKDKSDSISGSPLYNRVFIPGETKSVNVYGLDGNDLMMVEGPSVNSIQLRLFTGKGNDKVTNLAGGNKIHIYDYNNKENDLITSTHKTKIVLSANRDIVEYNRQAFHYNTYLPIPMLYYSPDNGVTAGLGSIWTFYHFAEQDFADKLYVSGKVSSEGNLQFKFSNLYHHAIGEWDWHITGDIAYPYPKVFFYGAGNETINLSEDESLDYYESRYSGYHFSTGLQRIIWRKSSFNLSFFERHNEPNTLSDYFHSVDSTFLGQSDLSYYGAELAFDLDFRDNVFAPKHGIRLFAKQTFNKYFESVGGNFTNSEVSLELYQTSRRLLPITLGIKGGASRVRGKIPFYELNTLGRTTGLRGYYRDRFSGNTTVYLDNQLTMEFGDVNTAIVPLTIGIFGYFDVGRVWVPDETSSSWHNGYGIGVYFRPLMDILTTRFSVSFSDEAKSGLFEFGFGLRL